jgi:hypothetical protein
MCSQPCSGATSGRYVADNVRRGTKGNEEEDDDEDEEEEVGREVKGRERSEMAEESGEGASEAEGLVGSGVNEIWMPCVPTVQSRYEVASSKSVRSDTLPPPTRNIPYHTIPYHTSNNAYKPTPAPKNSFMVRKTKYKRKKGGERERRLHVCVRC